MRHFVEVVETVFHIEKNIFSWFFFIAIFFYVYVRFMEFAYSEEPFWIEFEVEGSYLWVGISSNSAVEIYIMLEESYFEFHKFVVDLSEFDILSVIDEVPKGTGSRLFSIDYD